MQLQYAHTHLQHFLKHIVRVADWFDVENTDANVPKWRARRICHTHCHSKRNNIGKKTWNKREFVLWI